MPSKIIWLFLCYYVGYSHCCHLKLYKQENLKGPHHIQTIGEYGDEIKSLKNVGLCAWMVYRYVIVFWNRLLLGMSKWKKQSKIFSHKHANWSYLLLFYISFPNSQDEPVGILKPHHVHKSFIKALKPPYRFEIVKSFNIRKVY